MSKSHTVNKVTTVSISKDKSINEIKIPSNLNIDRLDFNKLKNFEIGKGNIYERECDYEWNEKIISIFASSDGKVNTENQYDFPPPIDSQLYFGNVLAICHINNKLTSFSEEDFKSFYDDAMGGFESLGDEDSYSDEEEADSDDSIRQFIVDDSVDVEVEEGSATESDGTEGSCEDSNDSEEDSAGNDMIVNYISEDDSDYVEGVTSGEEDGSDAGDGDDEVGGDVEGDRSSEDIVPETEDKH